MGNEAILKKAYVKATDNMATNATEGYDRKAAIELIKTVMMEYLKKHDSSVPEEEIIAFIKNELKAQDESEIDYTIEGDKQRIR